MNKIILPILLATTLLSAGAFGFLLWEKDSETNSDEISLLHVQTAESGTLLNQDDKLGPTLNEVSPITVYFSDRPNRITGSESTQDIVEKWSNSFQIDPPNAAIDILNGDDEQDVLIVELMNPVYNANTTSLQYDVIVLKEFSDGLAHYTDDSDDSIPESFGAVALFIDSTHTSYYCDCDANQGNGYECSCSYGYHLGELETREFIGYCTGYNDPFAVDISGDKSSTTCTVEENWTDGTDPYITKSCTNWNPDAGDEIYVKVVCHIH